MTTSIRLIHNLNLKEKYIHSKMFLKAPIAEENRQRNLKNYRAVELVIETVRKL
jgi:hypothetical protein